MGKTLQGLLSLIQKLKEKSKRPCSCIKAAISLQVLKDFLDDCSYIGLEAITGNVTSTFCIFDLTHYSESELAERDSPQLFVS